VGVAPPPLGIRTAGDGAEAVSTSDPEMVLRASLIREKITKLAETRKYDSINPSIAAKFSEVGLLLARI